MMLIFDIPPKNLYVQACQENRGIVGGISQSQLTALLVSTSPSWSRHARSLFTTFYDWNTFQVSLREIVGSTIIMSRGSLAVKVELLFDLFGMVDEKFKPVAYTLSEHPLSGRNAPIEYSKGELASPDKIGPPTCITLEGCSAVIQLVCARAGYYVENRHLQTLTEDIFMPMAERRIVSATLTERY